MIALIAAVLVQEGWKVHEVARGGNPLTAVAADYTGDGRPDVVADVGGTVRLYVAPAWREVVLHDAEKIQLIHSETFDVDGDGDPDWIGARYSPGLLFWLENPGGEAKGPWMRRLVDDQLHGSHALLKGDVDGDGRLDLIAGSGLPADGKRPFPESLAWLRVPADPRKAPRWERHVLAAGDSPGLNHYFGFGDVNGDGRPDVAAGAKGSPQADRRDAEFAWWEAPADRSKPWRKHVIARHAPGATNVHPADVNGDGRTDFIASFGHERGVLWYQAPDWTPRWIHEEIKEPHTLVVADLDGDGDVDAATCAFGAREAWWYENDGKGGFARRLVARGQSAYDLRAVDMDGDGDLDFLVAGRDSANVVWCENPRR